MTTPKPIVVCDLGGTRLKLGVVLGAQLLAQTEMGAEPKGGLADALQRIAKEIPGLCHQAKVARSQLGGFGLAFPGIIDPHSEKILSSPAGKFDDAKTLDVPALIKKLLRLPTRIGNDANAALAGEWHFGAAQGCRNVVMMTLGTGIGTAAILEGTPLRGQHGQAGCLGGHLTVSLDGRPCRCGNFGCAEAEASTWALAARAKDAPGFRNSQLAKEPVLDYAAVFRTAARGDRFAISIRDHSLHVWSVTLVNLIHAYDPGIALIGGGIMGSARLILPALRRHVSKRAWTPWGQVKIKPAKLGNYAGLFGCASWFQDQK